MSPCGDKLQSIEMELIRREYTFPSPCGDKLQCISNNIIDTKAMFPSPCGDKLQWRQKKPRLLMTISFRPLAGINCNAGFLQIGVVLQLFPSPCGDKLQLSLPETFQKFLKFPSPCGDKLQSPKFSHTAQRPWFPSPCGDKLQSSSSFATVSVLCGFRPLAGINCNNGEGRQDVK